jgi:hypothetical protein
MANQVVVYTEFLRALSAGEVSWSNSDFRVLLFMENSTVGQEANEPSILSLANFSTLDEFDGANYARKALTTQVIEKDTSQRGRWFWKADTPVFTNLGAGTRRVAGAHCFVEGADEAHRLPAFSLVYATPRTPDGSDFQVNWAETGLVIVRDASVA